MGLCLTQLIRYLLPLLLFGPIYVIRMKLLGVIPRLHWRLYSASVDTATGVGWDAASTLNRVLCFYVKKSPCTSKK